MDYEKKYKEAVCNIQKLLENGRKEGEVICAYEADFMSIFPELKESEDERIRKILIEAVKRDMVVGGTKDKQLAIAWLEKQGKKMSDPRYSILAKLIEADDIYQMSVNASMVKEAKNKAIDALSKLEISELLGLEKQGEQIPANSAKTCKDEQKPAEWSEEDEKILSDIIKDLVHPWNEYIPDRIEDEIKWLKNRLKSPRPQPKQEWSKDDEQYLLICKNALSKYQVSDKWDAGIISRWLEERLKSLRPQNRWKPSDEQIKVCKEVYADILSAKGFALGTVNSELNRLEEELKKLKE